MKVAYILALSSFIVLAACAAVPETPEQAQKRREDTIDALNYASGALTITAGILAVSPIAPVAVIPAVGAGATQLAALAVKHEEHIKKDYEKQVEERKNEGYWRGVERGLDAMGHLP